MNFNNIIMNPPYNKNLHLKILAEAVAHLSDKGKCVNLSPIRWLQDPLATYKKNSDYKRFNTVLKHLKNVEKIDSGLSEKIFGVRFAFDLGIYSLDDSTDKNLFSLLDNVITSIIKKSIDEEHSLRNHIESGKKDGWRVRINGINGGAHPGTIDQKNILHNTASWVFKDGWQNGTYWTEMGSTKNQYSKKIGDPFPYSISFSSYEEAKYFEDSTKTDFMHFLNVICKLNINFVDLLPWMGDAVNPRTGMKGYESEWIDEDFYKYFGITEDEQKIIETTMEKY